MDTISCGWLVEYEEELRERDDLTEEEIRKLVLEAVK